MTFGGLLAARRTQKNLSQAQLAERVGVSAQTVYRWEYDLRSPDVEQLKKLCAALDVAPGYFLCEEEKNETMPENKGTNDGRENAREAGEGERENCLVPGGENEKLHLTLKFNERTRKTDLDVDNGKGLIEDVASFYIDEADYVYINWDGNVEGKLPYRISSRLGFIPFLTNEKILWIYENNSIVKVITDQNRY